MFEDSLVESSGALGRQNPWTASSSFAIQGLLFGVLVLLPLIYTEALPWRQITAIVNAPAPPPPLATSAPTHLRTAPPHPMLADGVLHMPGPMPRHVAMVHDEETTS